MTTTSKTVARSDIPPNTRRGAEIRVLLGPATVGATTGFLGVATLEPGESIAEHYHPYSEEFLYVISGTLTVDLRQLQQLGSTLSYANEWDGPVAQRFRSEWPNESKALQQAITNLEALQKQAQQILQNIMKAGS